MLHVPPGRGGLIGCATGLPPTYRVKYLSVTVMPVGPGPWPLSLAIYRPGPPDNTGHNIAAEALVGASRCKGNGPALQGARAFGGGEPCS